MGTNTSGDLALLKPNNGEYVDGWDVVFNDNMEKIDTGESYLLRNVENACDGYSDTTALDLTTKTIGSADRLKKKLDTLLGENQLPVELQIALNDRLVGSKQNIFQVFAEIERFIYWLASGTEDTDSDHPDRLRNEIAKRGFRETNCVLTDNFSIGVASDIPVVTLSGAEPIDIDISGKTYHIHRALSSKDGALAASRGVAFLYAEAYEEELYNETDGVLGKDGAVYRKLTSTLVTDFTNARPGMILRLASKIVGDYNIGGDYIIDSVSLTELEIIGGFPVKSTQSSVTGVTFTVLDPFAARLGHDFQAGAADFQRISPSLPIVNTKAYLGEIHWNGISLEDSVKYRSNAFYDSGWLSVAALGSKPPNDPAVTAALAHNIGPVFTQRNVNSWSCVPKVRVLTAVSDMSGSLYDIQEHPFNSAFGGQSGPGTGTSSFERGWAGYCNRQDVRAAFGVKMPETAVATYAVQRKLDETSFMSNDPTDEASYITDPTNSYYRIIVSRK